MSNYGLALELADFWEAVERAREAAEGDSNDDEIQTLKAALDEAETLLASGVLLTRRYLELWADRTLTDQEVRQLRGAVPYSSIPQAIEVIANEALTDGRDDG
jgi:hypothetical protein